jgi:hypothetical protein
MNDLFYIFSALQIVMSSQQNNQSSKNNHYSASSTTSSHDSNTSSSTSTTPVTYSHSSTPSTSSTYSHSSTPSTSSTYSHSSTPSTSSTYSHSSTPSTSSTYSHSSMPSTSSTYSHSSMPSTPSTSSTYSHSSMPSTPSTSSTYSDSMPMSTYSDSMPMSTYSDSMPMSTYSNSTEDLSQSGVTSTTKLKNPISDILSFSENLVETAITDIPVVVSSINDKIMNVVSTAAQVGDSSLCSSTSNITNSIGALTSAFQHKITTAVAAVNSNVASNYEKSELKMGNTTYPATNWENFVYDVVTAGENFIKTVLSSSKDHNVADQDACNIANHQLDKCYKKFSHVKGLNLSPKAKINLSTKDVNGKYTSYSSVGALHQALPTLGITKDNFYAEIDASPQFDAQFLKNTSIQTSTSFPNKDDGGNLEGSQNYTEMFFRVTSTSKVTAPHTADSQVDSHDKGYVLVVAEIFYPSSTVTLA